MDNCEKVGLVIGCMSVILDILGIAIPYWSYISVDGAGGNSGLWIACGSASSLGYICLPYITVSDDLKVVRGIMVADLPFMIAVVACFLLKKFLLKKMVILFKVIGWLTTIACFLNVAGVVMYANDKKLHVPGTHLHVGFALCIVAAVFCVLGGAMMGTDRKAAQPKCKCPIIKSQLSEFSPTFPGRLHGFDFQVLDALCISKLLENTGF